MSSAFSGESYSNTQTFKWVIKNPCIDTDYVNIESPGLDELLYIIYNPSSLDYTHDPYFVLTTPEQIENFDLCGPIVYEGRLEGVVVPETGGDPLSYVPSTRTFTVDTDDEALINVVKPYYVYATF